MLLAESKEKLKELKERFEDVQLSLGTTFCLKEWAKGQGIRWYQNQGTSA
jgi:hypothetical protein